MCYNEKIRQVNTMAVLYYTYLMILVLTKLPGKKTLSCTSFQDIFPSLPLRKEFILQNDAGTKNVKLNMDHKDVNVLDCG